MNNISINDWVEVLKPDFTHYSSTAPVAHFGRVVESNKETSKVVLELWGRPDSFTNYFPLEFKNTMLRKV